MLLLRRLTAPARPRRARLTGATALVGIGVAALLTAASPGAATPPGIPKATAQPSSPR